MSQIADSIQIRNATFKNRIIKGAMVRHLPITKGSRMSYTLVYMRLGQKAV